MTDSTFCKLTNCVEKQHDPECDYCIMHCRSVD